MNHIRNNAMSFHISYENGFFFKIKNNMLFSETFLDTKFDLIFGYKLNDIFHWADYP